VPSADPATAAPAAAAAPGQPGSGTSSGEPDDGDRPAGPTVPDPAAAPQAVTAPVAPAAPVAAPAAAPATPPAVAAQLVPHVAVLRGGADGTHTMTVVLTPENLGPVHVQVTLDKGVVALDLRGAHTAGREALVAALPDLRRDLQSAGLTCSRLDVDRDTGGSWSSQQSAQQQAAQQQAAQQQADGRRPGTPGRGEVRPQTWVRRTDPGESRPAPASDRSTSRGVDVRV
jgi:flagellar hook-length control protein FliK